MKSQRSIRILNSNLIICLFLTALWGCGENDYNPKPKGYNRIDLPERNYQQLESDHPYTFEYSHAAEERDHNSYIAEPHWIDIYYPELDANIEITYKKLSDSIQLKDLLDDSHDLARKHGGKAYAIDETLVTTDKGLKGVVFTLEGEVPSQFQFAATDSLNNFLRAALYFKTATKNDSLAPVIEYVSEDMIHMLNTLEFKN